MSTKARKQKRPRTAEPQALDWRGEVAQHAISMSRKISQRGIVIIWVILGTIWLMLSYNKMEWPLIVFALVGLCLFLIFDLMADKPPHKSPPSDERVK
jgi:hypothetical protein